MMSILPSFSFFRVSLICLAVLKRLTYSLHNSLLTFLRRLDYQLCVVLPYVETKEVEALSDVCDECLFLRQFKASFGKERREHGLDLRKRLFVGSGDDEVVRVPHEVHFLCLPLAFRSLRAACRESAFNKPLILYFQKKESTILLFKI